MELRRASEEARPFPFCLPLFLPRLMESSDSHWAPREPQEPVSVSDLWGVPPVGAGPDLGSERDGRGNLSWHL